MEMGYNDGKAIDEHFFKWVCRACATSALSGSSSHADVQVTSRFISGMLKSRLPICQDLDWICRAHHQQCCSATAQITRQGFERGVAEGSYLHMCHAAGTSFYLMASCTRACYRVHISGRHNPDIAADLFPDWPEERRTKFVDEKEARYRRMAGEHQMDSGTRGR